MRLSRRKKRSLQRAAGIRPALYLSEDDWALWWDLRHCQPRPLTAEVYTRLVEEARARI